MSKYKLLLTTYLLLLTNLEVRASNFYFELFSRIESNYKLPRGLLKAICEVESDLRPHVVNLHDGGLGNSSFGLCQVGYLTALDLGMHLDKNCVSHVETARCKLLKPDMNVEFAARYLSKQLLRYSGDVNSSISAYNAGSKIQGNKKYVKKVLRKWGVTRGEKSECKYK